MVLRSHLLILHLIGAGEIPPTTRPPLRLHPPRQSVSHSPLQRHQRLALNTVATLFDFDRALSAFVQKSVRNATEGRNRLPRSQQTALGAEERLDSVFREDKMLVNETEWPRWTQAVGHMGNVG